MGRDLARVHRLPAVSGPDCLTDSTTGSRPWTIPGTRDDPGRDRPSSRWPCGDQSPSSSAAWCLCSRRSGVCSWSGCGRNRRSCSMPSRRISREMKPLVPTAVAAPLFPPGDHRTLRVFGVEQCLQLRRGKPQGAAAEQVVDPGVTLPAPRNRGAGPNSRAERWPPYPRCVRAPNEGRRRSCRGERGTPRAPGRLARPSPRASRSTPPEARPARRASTSS
jgi:hypothetical protein